MRDLLNKFNLSKEQQKMISEEISYHAFKNLTQTKIDNYFLSRREKKNGELKLESNPYYMVLEPTNSCNLRCPLCPTGLQISARKKGLMNMDNFKLLIDNIHEHCIELALQNWGEPTLNKKLPEMLKYCNEKNIFTIVSSNFSRLYKDNYLEELVKSGLNFLHIDLDGLDQETYKKYRRNGNLDIVLENIKNISNIKKNLNLKFPYLHCSMLAMKHNEHQISKFLEMKDELGVDEVTIDKIQVNPNTSSKWLPDNKKLVYESYPEGEALSKSSTPKSLKKCNWPWSGFVINWDGSVSPCCIVDDPNSDFGNIFDLNFKIKNLWNNDFFISSRAEFVNRNKITKNNICNICKNQSHNSTLNRVGDSFAIKL